MIKFMNSCWIAGLFLPDIGHQWAIVDRDSTWFRRNAGAFNLPSRRKKSRKNHLKLKKLCKNENGRGVVGGFTRHSGTGCHGAPKSVHEFVRRYEPCNSIVILWSWFIPLIYVSPADLGSFLFHFPRQRGGPGFQESQSGSNQRARNFAGS